MLESEVFLLCIKDKNMLSISKIPKLLFCLSFCCFMRYTNVHRILTFVDRKNAEVLMRRKACVKRK